MTVGELRNLLDAFPGDALVVVESREATIYYEEVEGVGRASVVAYRNVTGEYREAKPGEVGLEAIVLGG